MIHRAWTASTHGDSCSRTLRTNALEANSMSGSQAGRLGCAARFSTMHGRSSSELKVVVLHSVNILQKHEASVVTVKDRHSCCTAAIPGSIARTCKACMPATCPGTYDCPSSLQNAAERLKLHGSASSVHQGTASPRCMQCSE